MSSLNIVIAEVLTVSEVVEKILSEKVEHGTINFHTGIDNHSAFSDSIRFGFGKLVSAIPNDLVHSRVISVGRSDSGIGVHYFLYLDSDF